MSIGGTVLLSLFLTTFLPIYSVVNTVPWVLAFSTLVAGYSAVDRFGRGLERLRLLVILSAVISTIFCLLLLSGLFFYFIQELAFDWWDAILFLLVGVGCSEMGAQLALKYQQLKNAK
ncbi:MAG: hypothetical protein JRJ12_06150 [Deltaproteobacteria bacterium]|nr:hypothetical protein [Deltaproteobacteria bacterium]MBW2070771.1 hypothetical protein [Deltaproteobacteria bacterium]